MDQDPILISVIESYNKSPLPSRCGSQHDRKGACLKFSSVGEGDRHHRWLETKVNLLMLRDYR